MRLTIVAGVLAVSMTAVPAGQEQSQTAAPDHARALVSQLDLQRYKATVAGLAQFGDRREGTRRNRNAVDWIEAQLKSYGCETTRMSYDPANPTGEPPAPAPIRAGGRRMNVPAPRTPAGTPEDPFRRGAGNKGFGARTGVNRDPMAQPDEQLRAINAGPDLPGPVDQVYCTKRGTTRPGEMYIIGAHMDGLGYGAAVNDDASGTAIVMELARILSAPGVTSEVSIRFALWNGEEGDMMMFDHGMPNPDGTVRAEQRREADVNIEFQENSKMAVESQKLAWFFRNANEKYATDYPASVGNHMQSTDSVPFQDLIPSISLRENERRDHVGFGWNPHWHQPTDVMATYSDADFRLGLNAAQTTLAAIAQLAGVAAK
jgi:hypothetical protein